MGAVAPQQGGGSGTLFTQPALEWAAVVGGGGALPRSASFTETSSQTLKTPPIERVSDKTAAIRHRSAAADGAPPRPQIGFEFKNHVVVFSPLTSSNETLAAALRLRLIKGRGRPSISGIVAQHS